MTTSVKRPAVRLGSVDFAAYFLPLEDIKLPLSAPSYNCNHSREKRIILHFSNVTILAWSLASPFYLHFPTLRQVFSSFKICFQWLSHLPSPVCILVQSFCSLFAFPLYRYLVLNCLFFSSSLTRPLSLVLTFLSLTLRYPAISRPLLIPHLFFLLCSFSLCLWNPSSPPLFPCFC